MNAPEEQTEPEIRRVFISYAREDQTWAAERRRVLHALGLEVFFDQDSLRAGDIWPERLLDEIEKADLVWLGWSTYAAQSDWVKREYTAALAKGPGHLYIDRLDDTPLPDELKDIQAEAWPFRHLAAARLLRTLKRDLGDDPLPSHLLRPEYTVVPFTGRDEMIDDVRAWCASDSRFRVRLYTGPGGAGKTRLLIEICDRLRDDGWNAGFLHRESFAEVLNAEPATIDALFSPRLPRLMVVDYAETQREQVAALFRRAARKTDGQPIRLVLLARSEGDWWEQLLGQDNTFEELAGEGATPRRVLPLAPGLDDRRRLFEAAAAAFAETLQRPVPDAPDLTRQAFDRVLILHVAALAAVYDERSLDPQAIIDTMLKHEQRYWEGRAKTLRLDPLYHPTLVTCAALLTLVGGCVSVETAAAVFERNPDLAGESLLQRKRIAQVFADLYGTDNRIEAIQPDLLGENLVAGVFRKTASLRTAWFTGASSEEIHNGLTLLNRTANHTPEATEWLEEAICGDVERLAPAAISVAIENEDPIGRILTTCLKTQPDPELSAQLQSELPQQTVALRELAVIVTSQALQKATEETERSALLNNLGNRLRDLGRREEALTATEEAVAIRRRLAQDRPDAFLPNLAGSLNNLSVMLRDLGRLEEALSATEEVVGTYRRLAQDRPDAFLPNLAGSLNNLGNACRDLGRREEALTATEEAVAIRRRLAQDRPDAFLPSLASGLNNLGMMLSDLGRREEALRVTEEAVAIRRRLAQDRPDAFLPDFALSLNNLGIRYNALDRREEALTAAEEAVAIYRRLAQDRPDTFLSNLAMSLNNLAHSFNQVRRLEDSLEAMKKAVEIYRRLAQDRPDAFLPNLAASLNNLGHSFNALGRRGEALTATEEAVAIRRRLAQDRPDAFLPDLAGSLNNLGNAFSDLGRREEALAATEEAVKILLPFFRRFPSALARDMGMFANNYAQRAEEAGREPDTGLLQQVAAVFEALNPEAGER